MNHNLFMRRMRRSQVVQDYGTLDEKVWRAMRSVDRADFLPEKEVTYHHLNQSALRAGNSGLRTLRAYVRDESLDAAATQGRLGQLIYDMHIPLLTLLQTARPVTTSLKAVAYNDIPLPIGYGQTCSQPSLIAVMNDLLHISKGMRVLEIGTGCGYHAAITTHQVGADGQVYTMERKHGLAEMARQHLSTHFGDADQRLTVIEGDGSIGLPEAAPYDRIYLTAGVDLSRFDPDVLGAQLNQENGILLFPEEEGNIYTYRMDHGRRSHVGSLTDVLFVKLFGANS